MKVEEAFEAMQQAVSRYGNQVDEDYYSGLLDAARALALAAHIEACDKWQPGTHIDEERRGTHACGDGWLCEQARAIAQLGKESG